MSVVINRVVRQKASALSAGIAIVRQVLKDNSFPNGFTTKQMYELAQKYPPPPGFHPMPCSGPAGPPVVPKPEHPVRSVTFLKTMILPSLEGQQEIVTTSQPRSGAHPPLDLSNLRPVKQRRRNASSMEFVWKVIPPEERSQTQTQPKPTTGKKIVGSEVGVGADTSHLNKRRQRARVKKVTSAVLKLKGGLAFTKELEEVAAIAPDRP